MRWSSYHDYGTTGKAHNLEPFVPTLWYTDLNKLRLVGHIGHLIYLSMIYPSSSTARWQRALWAT